MVPISPKGYAYFQELQSQNPEYIALPPPMKLSPHLTDPNQDCAHLLTHDTTLSFPLNLYIQLNALHSYKRLHRTLTLDSPFTAALLPNPNLHPSMAAHLPPSTQIMPKLFQTLLNYFTAMPSETYGPPPWSTTSPHYHPMSATPHHISYLLHYLYAELQSHTRHILPCLANHPYHDCSISHPLTTAPTDTIRHPHFLLTLQVYQTNLW